MTLLQFSSNTIDLSQAYQGHHVTGLILLSVMTAILAAFASFSHIELMQRKNSRLARLPWHLTGAFAMGVGVWAMHFLGMLSFRLPVEVSYHLGLTLASIIPAVLAGYVTLYVIAYTKPALTTIIGGGVLMGSGIGAMHYIGMGAMVLQADRLYQPGWFLASIGAAITLATCALAIRPLLRRYLQNPLLLNLASSVLMGLAIASMHYVAMHATVFMPSEQVQSVLPGFAMTSGGLIGAAAAGAILIVLMTTTAVIMRIHWYRAEQSSQHSKDLAKTLQDRIATITKRVPGMVYELRKSASGKFSFPYLSDASYDIFGISPAQVESNARLLLDKIYPEDLRGLTFSIQHSAQHLSAWQHEFRVVAHTGHKERWLLGSAMPVQEEDGAISWSGFITDISDRKEADETIHHLAYYDALTNLPNRRMMHDYLQDMVADHQVPGIACYFDLDNFKRLNDTMGHSAGDQLLIQIAERLLLILPQSAVGGRLSSDEFLLLLPGHSEDSDFPKQLLHALNQPFMVQEYPFECSLSIGICSFGSSSFSKTRISAEQVLKHADIAMQEAKLAGGNCICLFTPKMRQRVERRYSLEADLREALAQQQLSLAFQPQLNAGGRITGSEALLRWQHPVQLNITPADFIPIAEETGLIVPIGYWVIEQACIQLKLWEKSAQTSALTLSINVSARQFYQPGFTGELIRRVQDSKIDPSLLILELTESLVLEDLEDAQARMQRIKAIGIRFAMDDFGTGYSSLAYLAELPFDEVKIDQSFLRDAGDKVDAREWIIIEAIIGIANQLQMQVIAEGIEIESHYLRLLEYGCNGFQGYYFSHPLPLNEFERLLPPAYSHESVYRK